MPTNLYGPDDNYHAENSHVIPALIRKFHGAKINNEPTVTVWGTGKPLREFLYSDDMAKACLHLISLPNETFHKLTEENSLKGLPPLVNVGYGEDVTIRELAELVATTIGYEGEMVFDTSKPDGTMQKLMSTDVLSSLGWHPKTTLLNGLKLSYKDFILNKKGT